jgi:putative spermidine/putrescine transport system substrate-binding protein
VKSPSAWKDLWNDGVVVAVPHVGQAYGLTFLYIAALMNGGNATNLDPGFEAIKRLKRIKIFKNVSQGMSLFQQNEVDAGLFYDTRAQQMADMGLPIAKAYPQDGNWGQRTGTQIPKLSGNMEGALAWINNSLSVPYQTAFAQKLYSPTNRDVVVPPDLAAKLIRGDARANAIKEIPWGPINSQRDAILDRWTREFGA